MSQPQPQSPFHYMEALDKEGTSYTVNVETGHLTVADAFVIAHSGEWLKLTTSDKPHTIWVRKASITALGIMVF